MNIEDFIRAIDGSKFLQIILEKGLLALVLLLAAFLFNLILQKNKLRGEAANKIASDRAKAYIDLWKKLAAVRPRDDVIISQDEVEEIESTLKDWYHIEAYALYMSWNTAKRYMLVRKALQERPINSNKIRKCISRLRTQLKVDCGIYSELESFLQLPQPEKSADKSHQPTTKRGG